MAVTEGRLEVSDGQAIFYRALMAPKPQAVTVILHGLGEHSGRYLHVMDALAGRGIASFAPDHRGHGRTARGRFGDIRSIDRVVEDVEEIVELAASKIPGPVFLLAHSMGAIIALLYLFRRQSRLRGAVLSGPPVAIPETVSPAVAAAAGFIARLAPMLPVQSVAPAHLASRDPAVVQASLDDPLCYNGATRARTGHQLLLALKEIDRRMGEVSLPLLLLHGADDRIISPELSRVVFDRVASTDKTRNVYPGLYHEIFNEREQAQVLDDTAGWMEEHLG